MPEAKQKKSKKQYIVLGIMGVALLSAGIYAAHYSVSQTILFTPRVPQSAPFIKVGMTKAEVIALWGPPHEVERAGAPDEIWSYYHGEGMIDPWAWPYNITFDAHGNVESIWS